MNDLYCKDFKFARAESQKAYDALCQTVYRRSRLDLEFLQKFIEFSSEALGTCQYLFAKTSWLSSKDGQTINYISFCAEYLGLSERTIQKLYQTYERFIICAVDGASGLKSFSWAIPLFCDMTLTKIFELLPVSLEQLRKDYEANNVSANMTQKQLREYVKSFSAGNSGANKVLEAVENSMEADLEREQEENTHKLKTYNKILEYINFFKNYEVNDVSQFKKLVVVDLQAIKRCLVKEFSLEIEEEKEQELKLVKN